MIGLVGVPHGDLPTDLPTDTLFRAQGVRGGVAPVRLQN
jgi:hypothetical protein